MKRILVNQDSKSWHDWRLSHLGGSDAAVLMGCGFMTPYQLYLNKLGLFEPEVTHMMQRGKELEGNSREQFIADFGVEIEPACVESSQYPFMAASLDGIDKDVTFIVEIKTGGAKALEKAVSGQVSDYQMAQIQHQLFVTELDKCILYFYDGQVGYPIEVYRDTKYINRLIEKEKSFWDGVLNFVPPPLTDKDYIQHHGKWELIAEELLQVQQEIRSYDALLDKEKELRSQLIELAGENSGMGGGVKLTRIPRRGAIEYSSIAQLKDLDLEPYRKPTQITWRLSKV